MKIDLSVIVPNVLRDRLNAALDLKLSGCPDAASERDELYRQLLIYYDEHGVIPDFTIKRKHRKKMRNRKTKP